MRREEWYRAYAEAGLALVPIQAGSKGPTWPGWQQYENCITAPEEAEIWPGNMGLAHAWSRTCALDLDNLEQARAWLAEKGVDLDALLDAPDAVQITSGRANRGKLIYRLPEGQEPLGTLRFDAYGLELRCASGTGRTVQDVLPPSIHPDTGKPYEWILGPAGDWANPPTAPPELIELWRSLLRPSEPGGVKLTPIGVEADRIRGALACIDPDLSYHEWIKVGMGLHHETQGADWGLDLWDEWSATGSKYKSLQDLEPHWRSFGKSKGRLVTIQTVFNYGGGASPEDFDDLTAIPPAPKPTQKFRVLPAHTFVQGQAPEWIIKGLLPRGALAVVYGESGAGKSFAALDIMAAMATGTPWNGLRTRKARVVYICAEGVNGFRMRLRAYSKHHSVDLETFDVGVIADAPSLLTMDHKLVASSINAWGGTDVIFCDTLAQMTPGANENSSEDMGKALGACRALHSATGALIVLVHHAGKDASRGARGWSGLKAAADTELEITRDGDARAIKVSKQKDGEDGRFWRFKLKPIDLGTDQDGDPITSCIVEYTTDQSFTRRQRLPSGDYPKAVLDCVPDIIDLFDASIPHETLVAYAMERIAPHPKGDDAKRVAIVKAIGHLCVEGWLVYRDGNISLAPNR